MPDEASDVRYHIKNKCRLAAAFVSFAGAVCRCTQLFGLVSCVTCCKPCTSAARCHVKCEAWTDRSSPCYTSTQRHNIIGHRLTQTAKLSCSKCLFVSGRNKCSDCLSSAHAVRNRRNLETGRWTYVCMMLRSTYCTLADYFTPHSSCCALVSTTVSLLHANKPSHISRVSCDSLNAHTQATFVQRQTPSNT